MRPLGYRNLAVSARDEDDYDVAPPKYSKNFSMPSISHETVNLAMKVNVSIFLLKSGVYLTTGSSAMGAESLHTLADIGNQLVLARGLQTASRPPDRTHPLGYGRASFVYAMVSAMAMFGTGAVVTWTTGAHSLEASSTSTQLFDLSYPLVFTLVFSFVADGYVLQKTLRSLASKKPPNMSYATYFRSVRDPFSVAVVVEDGLACTGVLIAAGGVGLAHYFDSVAYDVGASMLIGGLMAYAATSLVRMNYNFIVGKALDEADELKLKAMLRARPAVDGIHNLHTQWLSPNSFSMKAKVDFDVAFLSSRMTARRSYYDALVEGITTSTNPRRATNKLLALYAEDLKNMIEKEVNLMEDAVRQEYPQATFIELEPDSQDSYEPSVLYAHVRDKGSESDE